MRTLSKFTLLLGLASTLLPAILNAQAISERTYKYIERVQKMMEAEQHDEALTYLNRVQEFKMTDYDTAVIAQAKGEVLATVEMYLEAAQSFEQALLLEILGERSNQQLRLSTGQLYISEEHDEKGIGYLEQWIENEDEPRAEVLITMATAYSRLQDYPSALHYVERAIRSTEEPRLAWYDLWIALNFNSGRIDACIPILEEVISLFPSEKKYWNYLANMYLSKEQQGKSLAVLRLAYEQGYVSESRDILRLAKLYLYEGIPVKAADLLARALEKKQIEPTEKNYRLLAEAWYKSQEIDEAKGAFKSAGEKSETGEHDLYRAQMHLDSEEYEQAIEALEAAIKRGVKQQENAIMMLAMANFQIKRFDDALTALEKAKDHPKIAEQSKQWRVFIIEEKQRYAEYARLQAEG
ncbi:tetratricopeptide repeat protein [Pelagicoccus mobilis]|uniref:Tetratricopeptide repeat protein n=1 Tax=Pelagicoccus mobilis TaxID=415221 RepID=A0A934RXM0_9BACT|nr:tetratricopeptide repeat protein [Pelagicoccus mobilis]MBK1875433.1 tetratricopeptide repeat protein [Pelagicoccus mobilis]